MGGAGWDTASDKMEGQGPEFNPADRPLPGGPPSGGPEMETERGPGGPSPGEPDMDSITQAMDGEVDQTPMPDVPDIPDTGVDGGDVPPPDDTGDEIV